ncbi:50S ribosomal protein L25/general stress protein Ctc [Neokomagataea tanensis]|uniref:Large ribosomal subunit protein bL25 n=1 Tax=Neokomagataea tanensis TaxID=661191 RepID=A0A4Y6VBV1_9PROT|nr:MULTISPECIES: 50S ribosomal protein L25/general stress protein Ctc [Neokomagataea]QDH25865.1 50S ribosomal protein L25/general stress protein Ctc [Neokomagataea tanensis]
MTKLTTLAVSPRAKAGKGAARATRRAGLVPGVIYGNKQEPEIVAIDPRVIMKELYRGGVSSRVYNVAVEGGATSSVLIRDVQLHPVTDAPIHIDFQRVAAGHKIHVAVPVAVEGEAPGVKRGGVLNVVYHSVDVEVDPANIPEHFVADISGLDIHDTVRWTDLKGTEGTSLTGSQPSDLVIVSVAAPSVDEDAAEDAAAE